MTLLVQSEVSEVGCAVSALFEGALELLDLAFWVDLALMAVSVVRELEDAVAVVTRVIHSLVLVHVLVQPASVPELQATLDADVSPGEKIECGSNAFQVHSSMSVLPSFTFACLCSFSCFPCPSLLRLVLTGVVARLALRVLSL